MFLVNSRQIPFTAAPRGPAAPPLQTPPEQFLLFPSLNPNLNPNPNLNSGLKLLPNLTLDRTAPRRSAEYD